MHDVVVIGAGPAGSVAAERLADRGLDVVVLEEHAEVGSPVHCTGLLGDEAFAEFGLPRSLVLAQADAARFWGAAGQSFTVSSARVRAAIIDRACLDQHLAARAARAGAVIHRSWRAESIAVEPGRVVVHSITGSVEARACVLACGAHYRFHAALGLGRPDLFLQSAQLETPFPPMPGIEVQFGREIAPAGFAWLVPFTRAGESFARIGLMTTSRAAERFGSFYRSLTTRAGAIGRPAPAPRLKMLPLGPIARTFADRVVAVGDAAGLVKPTTGGGIYYGMLSGVMAADALARSLRRDRLEADALQGYETAWRRRLGAEIESGIAFRRIAESLSDESIDALIDLGRDNGVVPLLRRTASFNWHRKAAVALLKHPSVRRIVFGALQRGARPV